MEMRQLVGYAAPYRSTLALCGLLMLLDLPLHFHHQRRHGDLIAQLAYEVERLSHYITGTLLAIVPLLVTAMGAVVLMSRIDMLLAGLVALLVPAFYLVLRILGGRLRPLAQQIQAADAKALAIADENIDMLPAIKTFTREALPQHFCSV